MRELGETYELIFVDDGSRDASFSILAELAQQDPHVLAIKLSRNFGDQIARTAGLDHACGAAVITIDGDLQHPPELIPNLVREWEAGYQVVVGIRQFGEDEGVLKRWMSKAFHRVLRGLSNVDLTAATSDLRLLDRAALDALLTARERTRFLRGLAGWIGFSQTSVPFTSAPRHGGTTKYTWRRMIGLAIDAILAFSTLPIQAVVYLGGFVVLLGLGYAGYVVGGQWFFGWTAPDWAPLMVALLVLTGVQLIALGIVGEYVGRAYEEAKQRPLYIVEQLVRAETLDDKSTARHQETRTG